MHVLDPVHHVDDAMFLWDEETDDMEVPSWGAGTRVLGGKANAALAWALACQGLGDLTTTLEGGGGEGDWWHHGNTAHHNHAPDCIAGPRPQRVLAGGRGKDVAPVPGGWGW